MHMYDSGCKAVSMLYYSGKLSWLAIETQLPEANVST